MINRFYLKDYLSFKEVDLEFQKGLIVFSGASGAGKSILMEAILGLFGRSDAKAQIGEITLEGLNFQNESYMIEKNDEFTIKQTTTSKTRYFLNNQAIPKKTLQTITKDFAKHLHLKDTSDFENDNIIKFLDTLAIQQYKQYNQILENFHNSFTKLQTLKQQLTKINQDQQNIEHLKDFLTFEISKITDIDPKEGEYEELKEFKDIISKKEKIESTLNEAKMFLNNTHKISSALEMLDINSAFFDDVINEVNSYFENFYDKVANIEDIDIEQTLDRIEQLSKLIKKYGSITEALEYKAQKQLELEKYENVSFEKAILEKNIKKEEQNLQNLTPQLTQYRTKALEILTTKINHYLKYLYLENITIKLTNASLSNLGVDKVEFYLNNTPLNKISSGEFNRLRLALLTAQSLYQIDKNGILFLDEIDANLSGKESASIAQVLQVLSKQYQIFAISHQPQLSATANQHFLVYKENNISYVTPMDKEQRINEISRMISGENITTEATLFAKKLLEN